MLNRDETSRARRIATLFSVAAASALVLSFTHFGPSVPAAAAAAGPATANCQNEVLPPKPNGTAWTCSFDDEFDGSELDTTKWIAQTTAIGSFTTGSKPYEACYVDNANNVSVAGGYLSLTVRKLVTPTTCIDGAHGNFRTDYTGGSVSTYARFNQTYGRFEVRAKLPNTAVPGLQETMWLWPVNDTAYGPEPASGEIDYSEFYSQYTGSDLPYLHYKPASSMNRTTHSNVQGAYPAPNAEPGTNCTFDPATYNTFAMTWAPNSITITVNRQLCLVDHYSSTAGGSAPFDRPFFLAMTQALGIGTNAATAKTPVGLATTKIDYIRVWK